MIQRIALLAFVALSVLAAGCSSTGGGSGGSGESRSLSVSLIGYGSAPFTLVSESNTSRVELYSAKRTDASTKVQTDEVMIALYEHLEDLGYEGYANPGSAPREGSGALGFNRAIEVVHEGQSSWWPLRADSGADERTAFATALKDFLDIYNLTHGFQSVTNEGGDGLFDQKKGAGGN
ncbi:MAG: hypothetical protein AAF682_15390 [Planctomycetota bacterium]